MANPTPSQAWPSPFAAGLAGALALAVAMGIGRFAFTPMLPLMVQAGQLDVAGGGWLAAANYAGYLLGALTAARTGWPATRLAATALLATAALTAAMAWPGGLALWMVLRLLAGVASAWVFVGTSVWCLGALAARGPTPWSSGFYAGVGSGIALAGLYCLVAATAGAAAGPVWLQLGALALLLSLPVLRVMSRLPAAMPKPAAAPAAGGALPAGTRGLVACYALLGFGYILPATYLPVLAREVVADPRLFGLAWPVFGTTAAVSTVLAAGWLRRASRLQVWAACHVAMGAGVLLPSVWLAGWSIALSALLVGGTFMVVTLAGVQEIRARTAAHDATGAVGRMTAAFAVGQIAGPLASNALLHLAPSHGLALALQAGAAVLFASAAWLWSRARAESTQEIPNAA